MLDAIDPKAADALLLAGRLCLASVFAASAFAKFQAPPEEMKVVTGLHLPAPRLVLAAVGLFEACGVVALVLGVEMRAAALVLAIFLLGVSVTVLRFWSPKLPPDVRAQMWNAFVANIAIIGGLLTAAAAGPGALAWAR